MSSNLKKTNKKQHQQSIIFIYPRWFFTRRPWPTSESPPWQEVNLNHPPTRLGRARPQLLPPKAPRSQQVQFRHQDQYHTPSTTTVECLPGSGYLDDLAPQINHRPAEMNFSKQLWNMITALTGTFFLFLVKRMFESSFSQRFVQSVQKIEGSVI